jgi:site-specific DNA-cytosine methylase
VLKAESNTDKQAFLASQHRFKFLVADVKDLKAHAAVNVLTDTTDSTLLPFARMTDGGFPCVSRTPLSTKRHQNVNCVQEQREATGDGFGDAHACVTAHNQEAVTYECVQQLKQKVDGGMSDAEYICNTLEGSGCWADCETMDARDFGSYPERVRVYWVGLKNLIGKTADITHFFRRVLNSCKLVEGPFMPSSYITHDDATRLEEAHRLGLKLYSEYGPKVSKQPRADAGWKLEHKHVFHAHDVRWPIVEEELKGYEFGGMLPREAEVSIFVNQTGQRFLARS